LRSGFHGLVHPRGLLSGVAEAEVEERSMGADEMMTIPLGVPAMFALLVFAAVAYMDLSR